MSSRLPEGALICVDFDDTLVENQRHFEDAVCDLCRLLEEATGTPAAAASAAVQRLEARTHGHGRHRNRFLLTVLGAYGEVAGSGSVPLRLLPALAAIAAAPYDALPSPAPGAEAALRRLRAAHRGPLWLVTTGDPVIQAGRVQRSGLSGSFDAIHVLPEKDAAAFAALGAGHDSPWMIGNSPVTDILPALQAGFQAVHVRAATWWLDVAAVPADVPAYPDFAAAVEGLLAGGAETP